MMRVPTTLRLLGWVLLLTAGHIALTSIAGLLEFPALSDLGTWISTSDAVMLPVASLWLGTTLGLWYLTVSTILWLLAGVVQWQPLTHLAGFVTIPMVQRTVRAAVGVSLAAAVATPVAAHAGISPAPPVLVHLGPAEPAPQTTTTVSSTVAPTAPPAHHAATPPPVAPQPSGERTWTVKAGENLWVIAEAQLTEDLDRSPTEFELLAYWRELQSANNGLLNPDVIHPGQHLTLPE